MKNLELVNVENFTLCDKLESASCVAVDGKIIYAIKDGHLYSFDIESREVQLLSDTRYNCITSLVFLTFQNQLWFGTGEEMVFYSPETREANTIPMESKFDAAVWNPTEEALLVVFSDGKVGLYTFDLEDYTSYCMGASALVAQVPQSVYVGWGSEKTQFRGSEGKLGSRPVVEEKSLPVNDKTPKISWRGNGEMFVINYWKDQERTFKVFEYPCKPAFEVEKSVGLQLPIAWRPTGNVIACPVVKNGKHTIAIFEKNGCKRLSFDLVDAVEVKSLDWSPTGKILAVHQKDDSFEAINLYYTSNYKWYLKQSLRFPQKIPLLFFEFVDASRDLLALRVIAQGRVINYTFKFTVHSSLCNEGCSTACAVIDGRKLLLTSFGARNFPPPMANDSICLEAPINFVAFNSNANEIAIVDSDYNIVLYDYNLQTIKRRLKLHVHENTAPLQYRNFCWLNKKLSYLSAENNSVRVDSLKDEACDSFETTKTFNVNVSSIITMPGRNEIIYTQDNEILLSTDNRTNFQIRLPSSPVAIKAQHVDEVLYVFASTRQNAFFVNDQLVANNVTSFVLQNNYLLFITGESKLYCVRLNREQINSLAKRPALDEFYSRSVEQNANLVCAVSNSPQVVLQMPRGNLEIISCRLIAVDMLENLLQKGAWREAVYFIRSERLNANLLIDLNPERFIENVDKFVEATKSASILNAIIQEIADNNVLRQNFPKCSGEKFSNLENKCKVICGEILKHFEKIDYANYITSIVIICVHHFTIESALIYVQDLLKRGLQESVKAALQTLKVYVNEDVLYKKALLLYDIDLAWCIARNCQMDPCEYEPFLLKLKASSEIAQRFEINVMAGKPSIAAKYLARMGDVSSEILLEFARKHNVSHIIYEHVSSDSPVFVDLSKLYAKRLRSLKNHDEAAVVYARCDLWREALDEYVSALNWRRALFAMNRLELSRSERENLVDNLSERLLKHNRAIEAGQVYEECFKDYKRSIDVLMENACFVEAVRVAQKYDRNDIIENEIADSARDYGKALVDKIKDLQEKFRHHYNRLLIVRQERLRRCKNEALGFEEDGRMGDFDLYSDTESRSSRTSGSRRTTASRNARRTQKKINDLREGGVYEDAALLKALHGLVIEIFKIGPDVRELCLFYLEEEKMYGDVKYLHGLLSALQNSVKEKLPEIWLPCFTDCEKSDATMDETILCENVLLLDEEYRIPPSEVTSPDWRLSIFNDNIKFNII